MVRENWIKISVGLYVSCILTYNFFGTASPAWTNFYYTMEKGFAVFCIAYSFQESKTLIDKLFINYALITQVGTWLFFIAASFQDKLWVYHQSVLVSTMIIGLFGSLIALYWMIKTMINKRDSE